MTQELVLPSFYLGPIAAYAMINRSAETAVFVEMHEHFPKQTYRNRASIYSPNGKLDLIVPVVKGSKVHTKMKDVRIAYEYDWQRQHWMSLQTSYRRSAFFEYYEDDLAPFYEKRFVFLVDLNGELQDLILRKMKMPHKLGMTDKYGDKYTDRVDLRHDLHPKKTYVDFTPKPYFQVFEPKHGFIPRLSIVDLLFNQGPNSKNFL